MKKLIIVLAAVAVLAVVLLLLFSGSEKKYQRPQTELFQYSMYDKLPELNTEPSEQQLSLLTNYDVTAQNGVLRLYVQKSNGNIAVFDKRSGQLYFNTVPTANIDSIATEDTKKLMQSVLQLTYFDGSVEKTINSFELSDLEKLTCEAITNGVRITYVLGDSKRGLEDIPQKLTDERFQALFVNHPDLKENDKKRAKVYYEQDESSGVWILTDTKNSSLNFLSQILDRIKYTDEDLRRDNEENGLPTLPSGRMSFTIPVEYTLEAESLRVSVAMEDVVYTSTKPLLSICVNRYFGATASKDGAILLPEGTGGLMYFSQEKSDTGSYSSTLYGSDDTFTRENSHHADNKNMLPIFGLYEKSNGFLCIIEEGDALATISAEKANGRCDLNSAWVSFAVRSVIRAVLGDGSLQSDVRVLQSEMYTGLLSWKYSFINEDDISYADLATYYRGYLTAKHNLQQITDKTMPLQLSLIGGVNVDKSFLGIQYKGTRVLTSYEEAGKIYELLRQQGITEINMLYSGLLKGGLGEECIANMKLDGALGKKKELKALAEKEGLSLYLSMNALTVPEDAPKYDRYRQTAKTIDDSLSKRYHFNIVDLTTEKYDYIISPLKYADFAEKLQKFAAESAFDGIFFNDLGSRLYSHNADTVVFRQDTKQLSLMQLHNYAKDKKLVLSNPYEAALPYASVIVDLPAAKITKVIDQAVPFYQMTIHSLIDYSSAAINEAVDTRTAVLNCVETGSIPYFKLFAAAQDSLTDTEFSTMYSHGFYTWQDEVVSAWKQISVLYEQVGDKPITDHSCVTDGVYKTVYGDSVAVYTNYNSVSITVDGITVEAENYKIEVME